MPVLGFGLEKFMAFDEKAWIELRPLTLLFGANSHGKSAIIRSLQLLSQSLVHGTPDEPLAFIAEDGIDLGNFESVIHKNQLQERITFHFKCTLLHNIDLLRRTIRDVLGRRGFDISSSAMEDENVVEFSFGFGWDKKYKKVALVGFQILCPWESLPDKKANILIEGDRYLEMLDDEQEDEYAEFQHDEESETWQEVQSKQESWTYSDEWQFITDLLDGHEHDDEEPVWASTDVVLVSGFLPSLVCSEEIKVQTIPSSAADFVLVDRILGEIRNIIADFLHSYEYLGPIRPEPQRLYLMDKLEQKRWQARGLSAYIEFLKGDISQPVVKEIAGWLDKMELGMDIESSQQHAGELGFYSQVNLFEAPERFRINLRDEGYGTAQILAVIVQSILSTPAPLIVIEQPELHLHPKAQAILGDFFIDLAQRGAKFLIETHSEHLLLRIRRRIAEYNLNLLKNEKSFADSDKFSPDKLAAYFVNRAYHQSEIRLIEISEVGDIVHQEEEFQSFFSDDVSEIMKLTDAALDAELLIREKANEHSTSS